MSIWYYNLKYMYRYLFVYLPMNRKLCTLHNNNSFYIVIYIEYALYIVFWHNRQLSTLVLILTKDYQ